MLYECKYIKVAAILDSFYKLWNIIETCQSMSRDSSFLITCLHTNSKLSLSLGNYISDQIGRKVYFACDDSYFCSILPRDSLFLTRMNSDGSTNFINNNVLKKLKEIYRRDRFLKYRLKENLALDLLYNWYNRSCEYFAKHEIGILVIEGTPAFELVLELAAREVGATVVCPAQIVYGGGNSGILYSESTWSNSYNLGVASKINRLEKFDAEKIFSVTDTKPTVLTRVLNFVRKRSLNSPKRLSQISNYLIGRFVIYIGSVFSKNVEKLINREEYALYFLHIDPEKSVDNSGSKIWPQLEVIRHLRSLIPNDIKLLVREHPQNKYKRRMRELVSISKMENTHYISAKSNRNILISNALFTTTISGSISLETAMLGKVAFVYGKPIFLYHPNVRNIDEFENGWQSIEKETANQIFSNFISNRLGKFVFGDVNLMSFAMSEENICNLTDSILAAENNGWNNSGGMQGK